jgi:uncharacterized protein YciI
MAAARPWLLLTACLAATSLAAVAAPPEYEMTTYQLAFLEVAADADEPSPETARRLQEEHLAFLKQLVDAGQAVMVGPLVDAAPRRGLVVLALESVAAAAAVLSQDPWIRSGRLRAVVHPWWAAKGILQRPPAFMDLEPCWLGLLQRPADAPTFTDERLAELQAGHMANMQVMAAAGALAIAGPMGDDTPLRGIFVFRPAPRADIEALVARDPAVSARRLEVVLIQLMLPKGTLPPPG